MAPMDTDASHNARGEAASEKPTWTRSGYPTEGEVVQHSHGEGVGHAHIGGDQPHGHRHRKVGPDEFTDEFYETATYTLDRARQELARQDCANFGHSWDVVESLGIGPTAIVCSRCGESHKVARDGD